MLQSKKLFLHAALAAVAFIAASCSSGDNLVDDNKDDNSSHKGTHTVSLIASVGSTRTGLTNNGDGTVSFYWHKGESIGVQIKNSNGWYDYCKFTTNDSTGSTTATFTGEVPDGFDVQDYALYPYLNLKDYDESYYQFTGEKSAKVLMSNYYETEELDSLLFPKTQDEKTVYPAQSTNMPMLGTITDGTISFKHLAGMVVIRIDKMPIKYGTLSFSADQKICGNFNVSDLSAEDVQLKSEDIESGNGYEGLNYSFSSCDIGKRGVFFIPLPVGTYTNCKVSLGNPTETQTIPCESITMERGHIRSLSITTNSQGKLRYIRSLGNNEYMVNGQKFIDLGFDSGLLWAETNIGSKYPQIKGNFYAWGETETKSSYTADNAKWGSTAYTADTVLTAEDDVASVLYGTAIHIPTRAEFEQLGTLKRVYYNEYDDSAHKRRYFNKFTSKLNSDQYLYLPRAGVMDGTSLSAENDEGDYWTSEPSNTIISNEYRAAYYLLQYRGPSSGASWTPGVYQLEPMPLYRGLNIRAVTYK